MDEKYLQTRRKFSVEEKKKILLKTDCKCGHCGKKQSEYDTTIDHIIPLDKGGLNDEYNLIALCEKCNNEKANFLYRVQDYYPHVLPEYVAAYYSYHSFALFERFRKSLFAYDAKMYSVHTDQAHEILYRMQKRHAKEKDIIRMYKQLGIKVSLQKAYPGDADDIMHLINQTIEKSSICINSSYYANEFAVLEDIKNNEVYVLRKQKTVCGAFLFKRIDDDTLPFIQIRNIIEESSLHAKYIMTGAFVTQFAESIFNEVMTDIVHNMITNKGIPIFFNMLRYMFKDSDQCISIPYELDGQTGTIDFMPMGYIRKMVRESCESAMRIYEEDLDETELDILTDAVINYSTQKQIDASDDATRKLFKDHEKLRVLFKPDNCELYGVGFLE